MNLKHSIALLILVTATHATEPSELTEARARYNAAMAASAKPILDKYIRELQQLKSRALSLQKLEDTIALDRELKSLGVTTTALTSELPKTSGLQPLAAMLPGTKWSVKEPKQRWRTIEFTSDSKLVLIDSNGPVGGKRDYEISKDGNTVEFKFQFGDSSGLMVFSKSHRDFEFLGDKFKQVN